MAVPLALVAALLFALGSVLQARAGEGSATTLRELVRRPRWIVGVLADGLGYGAQAAALAVGRLAVVQPLLAASLVFALPLAAWFEGRRVTRAEIGAALAVTAGLALFVGLAEPTGGRSDAGVTAWAIIGLICLLVCALSLNRGAIALGCATGVLFGVSAALTKAVTARLDEGVLHALLDWHVVALIVVGYAGLWFAQASLQAGALGTAVAAQLSLDAITSVTIGLLAFGERLHSDPLTTALALAGVAIAIAGIVRLAPAEDRAAAAPA